MISSIVLKSENQLPEKMNPFLEAASSIFILTDSNVAEHCLPSLLSRVEALGSADIIEVDAGEASKSIEICSHIWSHLLENNAGRDSLLINLGGGVITDLGGFVASTYKRGIPYIQVPTSLLAMVDAASGGKTGIDHGSVKNSVGTFSSPAAIFTDPTFLSTLPEKEWRSGFAEMLKHSLIADAAMWSKLSRIRQPDQKSVAPFLKKNISIKEKIAASDWKDQGERHVLNFGHTIGHALESYALATEQSLSHGEAVAYGMMVETLLSVKHNRLKPESGSEILDALLRWYSYNAFSFPSYDLLKGYLGNDKKNKSGKNRWVLLSEIGKADIHVSVTEKSVEQMYTKWVNASGRYSL